MSRLMLRLGALATVAVTALSSAGCGDAPARAAGGRITVYAREYAEIPGHIEAAPGLLRITLRNKGVQDHDLVIRRGDTTLARLRPIPPGRTGTLAVRLRPGAYELECTEWRHAQLGEHAQLRVR